jgi:hypothetical protein
MSSVRRKAERLFDGDAAPALSAAIAVRIAVALHNRGHLHGI